MRMVRVMGAAVLLALLLTHFYVHVAAGPHGMLRASMARMKTGTADQPFVRRQLLPMVLRVVDGATSPEWRAAEERRLRSNVWVQRVSWTEEEGTAVDFVICVAIWVVCLGVFFYVMELESAFYLRGVLRAGWRTEVFFWVLTLVWIVLVMRLLRDFIFAWDVPTLAFGAVALRSTRRERLVELLLLTVVFSLNRETAFLVPGLVLLHFCYRHEVARGVRWGGLLGAVYLMGSGGLAWRYRANPGVFAENHRDALMQMYLGGHAPSAPIGAMALVVYGVAVWRFWAGLSPTLRAFQWFVPLWVALHLAFGYPKEWRVFLEIVPGGMLTVLAIWGAWRQERVSGVTINGAVSSEG